MVSDAVITAQKRRLAESDLAALRSWLAADAFMRLIEILQSLRLERTFNALECLRESAGNQFKVEQANGFASEAERIGWLIQLLFGLRSGRVPDIIVSLQPAMPTPNPHFDTSDAIR